MIVTCRARTSAKSLPSGRGSAVKKSHARIASAWERRNRDQAGPLRRGAGSMLAFFKIFHTVDAGTRTPRSASSPWHNCGSPSRGSRGPGHHAR